MKNPFFILIVAILAFPSFTPYNFSNNHQFRITNGSKLQIIGQTNINSFSCDCGYSPAPIFYDYTTNDNSYHFNKTSLNLSVKGFDCGNKMMNKDLQKALNADTHPFIKINLIEVLDEGCQMTGKCNGWVQMQALTKIFINGISNDYWLDIAAMKLDHGKFRFVGQQPIRMSEFCIDPPTALMGMVQVKNEIDISLDLIVEISK